MSKKKILVTGGLGFIGSNLVKFLCDNGYNVDVIDNLITGSKKYINNKANYYYFDLNNFNTVRNFISKNNYKTIFHLAALPRIEPSYNEIIKHDDNNIRSTLNLLTCLINKKKKFSFIFSSSSSVYGEPKKVPTSEKENVDPLNPYALQKYSSEHYVKVLSKYHNFYSACLRYFNPYGENSYNDKNKYNAYSSVIGIFENCLKNQSRPTIFGNGSKKRDFIHVSDVAKINLMVANYIRKKKINNLIINVGTGRSISIIQLTRLFGWKKKDIIFKKNRSGEASITLSNNKLFKKLFPYYQFQKIEKYIMSVVKKYEKSR